MRIRSVKPEFWKDERLARCLSREARLVYIALWNESDDEGRLRGNRDYLHGALFPYDPGDWFDKAMGEIVESGRGVEYRDDGDSYLHLPKLLKHQRINRPTKSALPVPPSLTEPSRKAPAPLTDGSPLELGSEGARDQGSELQRSEGSWSEPAPASPPPPPSPKRTRDPAILEVWEHWKATLGHPASVLDPKREGCIARALKAHGIQKCKAAIDGCSRTPWNMGENPGRKRYDSITLIFRDADQIERFASEPVVPPSGGLRPSGLPELKDFD